MFRVVKGREAATPEVRFGQRRAGGRTREQMGYECSTCGAWHDERPTAFVARMPSAVAHLSDAERAARVVISSDQCILDEEHFFVIGNLHVPVRDSSQVITWTVWSTFSRANFERCSELWHTEGRESEPPYFGWLSNQVPGYPDSINIKILVHTQAVGIRPTLDVIEESHPLHTDQKQGITPGRAEELIHVALYGAAG